MLCSCEDKNVDIANFRISHYKQAAVGLYPTFVFLVQEGDKFGTDEWEYQCSEIEGFDYKWGYVYECK